MGLTKQTQPLVASVTNWPAMDANTGAPSVQENVILAVALVLFCRAMWKFLNRVNATTDDVAQASLPRRASHPPDPNNNEPHPSEPAQPKADPKSEPEPRRQSKNGVESPFHLVMRSPVLQGNYLHHKSHPALPLSVLIAML